MTLREHVSLAPFTTFHIGGDARYFAEAASPDDVREAAVFARERGVPLYVLGAGSNVLVPDEGVNGVVLHLVMQDIVSHESGTTLIVDAGVSWDRVVDEAATRGLYGIENLAGVPGTMGGAVVQNIGAYGAELAETFAYADVLDTATLVERRIERRDAAFGYRTSIFKRSRDLVILRAALALSPEPRVNLEYADLARARAAGTELHTPSHIAAAVRAIRADKFPRGTDEGTAGSFFKNPVISREAAGALADRFPGLPVFEQADGSAKVPLAWLLDHALALKGYARGPVRLYEKQPLIVVASRGARAREVDALVREVEMRVHTMTGITIEREVETFAA